MARETLRPKDMTDADRKAIGSKRKDLTPQEMRTLKRLIKKRGRG